MTQRRRRGGTPLGPLAGTPYSLVSRLGEGGAGEVYLARHEALDKKVALKLLHARLAARPDVAQRLRREAKLLARIRHPSLVDVHDLGVTADGRPYYVMEHAEGVTLREHLESKGGRLGAREACELLAQVLDGLAAAHEAGVVHRDVKPLNILVTPQGRARLLDFGVAKVLGDAEPEDVGATKAGLALGTPRYMAPEQACGETPTPAVDVYAVGCVLYEVLTGGPPFDAEATSEVVRAHVSKPAPKLDPELDDELAYVVSRALEKGAALRPTATAMAEELRSISVRLDGKVGKRSAPTRDLGTTPMRSRSVRRTNLKPPVTSFLGRDRELLAIHGMLADGDCVVTLLGSAGTGKSRLATRYVELHHDEYAAEGGVWLCDLTEARGPEKLCAAVGNALDVSLRSGESASAMVSLLGQAMAGRGQTLLILDSCEHVAADVAQAIDHWHSVAPAVRFLATSREVLHLPGERVYEVPPLGVPDTEEEAASSEAVQLFVDRARRVRPDYALSPAEAEPVTEIVRRLDGLPLAIELAAARMNVMSAQEIVKRLPRRFELLASGARGVSERQRTMRGAIDWSWQLLAPWEKAALGQCAVFRGSFSLEAAEHVLDLEAYPDAPPPLDAVQALRDKSYLRSFEPPEAPGELWFVMYESIREFASEKLLLSGDQATAVKRHARYFTETAAALAREASGHAGARAVRRLGLLMENILAAHESSLRHGDVVSAARAAAALERVALDRGPYATFHALYETTLAAAEKAKVDQALIARLLVARSFVRMLRLDRAGARADGERAATIARARKDPMLEVRALQVVGQVALPSDVPATDRAFERIKAIIEKTEDRQLEGLGRMVMGLFFVVRGQRLDEARVLLERAHDCLQEVGDLHRLATVLHVSGVLLQELGRLSDARVTLEQAIEMCRATDDRFREASASSYLAGVHFEERELDLARALAQHAVRSFARLGERWQKALAMGLEGAIQATRDETAEAARLIDTAEAELRAAGDKIYVSAVTVHRGQLDLALGRACHRAGDVAGAARHRVDAEKRLREVDTSSNDDVRFAARMLRRELARAPASELDAPPAPSALVVASDGAWFRPPHGRRVDLAERKALRLLLSALADRRVAAPGEALSTDTLLARGWPGERVQYSAGRNRVRVAMTTLRRLGMKTVLKSDGDGYFLDPGVPVALGKKKEKVSKHATRT